MESVVILSRVLPYIRRRIVQWRIQGFSKGGVPPLRLVFKGGGGSTIILGFQRGVPLSKCVILTLFLKNFLTKGGVPTPGTPPPSGSANVVTCTLSESELNNCKIRDTLIREDNVQISCPKISFLGLELIE
jgi:hypothetical protein